MLKGAFIAVVTLALLPSTMPLAVASAQELTGKRKKPVGYKLDRVFVKSWSTSGDAQRKKPTVKRK